MNCTSPSVPCSKATSSTWELSPTSRAPGVLVLVPVEAGEGVAAAEAAARHHNGVLHLEKDILKMSKKVESLARLSHSVVPGEAYGDPLVRVGQVLPGGGGLDLELHAAVVGLNPGHHQLAVALWKTKTQPSFVYQ